MNSIEFPNLGLFFKIKPEIFSVGPFSVHWYGLLISIGFMLAVIFGLRYAKTQGVEPDIIIDLLIVTVPLAIIGARLYYVIFNLNYYIENPLDTFKIWEGGLAIYGAIIAVIITVYYLAKRKKLNALLLFDIAMPYIAMAQAVGRWGNFVNQEAFGSNTDLPWGMTGNIIKGQLIFMAAENQNIDPTKLVHPTFLYESLWCLLIFAVMLFYRKRIKIADGEVFALYFITYGLGRAAVEGLRTDSLMFLGMRVSQILSLILVIAGIGLILFFRKRKRMAVVSSNATYIDVTEDDNENENRNNNENKNDSENINKEDEPIKSEYSRILESFKKESTTDNTKADNTKADDSKADNTKNE